jgi:hypothetical protein
MKTESNYFVRKTSRKILSYLWRLNYSDKYSCRFLHKVCKQILIPGPFRQILLYNIICVAFSGLKILYFSNF